MSNECRHDFLYSRIDNFNDSHTTCNSQQRILSRFIPSPRTNTKFLINLSSAKFRSGVHYHQYKLIESLFHRFYAVLLQLPANQFSFHGVYSSTFLPPTTANTFSRLRYLSNATPNNGDLIACFKKHQIQYL